MEQPNNVRQFFEAAAKKFRRLPAMLQRDPGRGLKVLGAGAAGGGIVYCTLPELLSASRVGSADEIAAGLAAVATILFGSLTAVRHLCGEPPERQRQKTVNELSGAAGGAVAGGTFASLTAAALWSVLDGGILVASTVIGYVGAKAYNVATEVKHCPYPDCETKGQCSQRVCRRCLRIFYPEEGSLDSKLLVNWLELASYLQKQGLNYYESQALVKDHFKNWQLVGKTHQCFEGPSLKTWLEKNVSSVADYIGHAEQGVGTAEKHKMLDDLGL